MRLTHVFVDSFPEPLESGKLYVSMRFANVAHLCACGCGSEVVTPIRKRAWKLIFDGESITLSPSIGNHNLRCESHYFIRESEIIWAGRLSEEEIYAGRRANHQGGIPFDEKDSDEVKPEPLQEPEEILPVSEPEQPLRRHWWEVLMFWKRRP